MKLEVITLNNKGFATTGIILAVLLITMIVITLFLNPILNTSVNVKNSKEFIPEYVNNINGVERVYSVFKENISHNKDISFEDIGKEYRVTQIKEDYSDIQLILDNYNTFNVNNKTDINIYFEVYPIDYELPHSYSVNVLLNNNKIVASADDMVNNSTMNIANSYLYNEETGETNYGEYKVDVDTTNCNVVIRVEYKKLDYREIKLSNENIEQNIGIKNNTDRNSIITEIYFIQ